MARHSHSSCVLGNNLYVFGGKVGGGSTNSIEWCNVENDNEGFTMLVLAMISPRCFAGMSILNDEELVIMGGAPGLEREPLNDVWVFNKDKNSYAMAVKQSEGPGFMFKNNQLQTS